MLYKLKQYEFLFEELVKRDFKKKYKRTVLGLAWSRLVESCFSSAGSQMLGYAYLQVVWR